MLSNASRPAAVDDLLNKVNDHINQLIVNAITLTGDETPVEAFKKILIAALLNCASFRMNFEGACRYDDEVCLFFLENTFAELDDQLLRMAKLKQTHDALKETTDIASCALYKTFPQLISRHIDDEIGRIKDFKAKILLMYVERTYFFRPGLFKDETFKNQIFQMSENYKDYDADVAKIKFIFSALNPEEIKALSQYKLFYFLDLSHSGEWSLGNQLVYELAAKELIARVRAGLLEAPKTIQSFDWHFAASKNLKSKSIRIEFCEAVFYRLNEIILSKLKLAQANNNSHPWKLGYFGSTSKIRYQDVTYQVPGTIYTIHKLIADYNSKKSSASFDDLFTAAEATLKQIEELLEIKADRYSWKTNSQAFVDGLNTLIGRGTAKSTEQDYCKMRELTM